MKLVYKTWLKIHLHNNMQKHQCCEVRSAPVINLVIQRCSNRLLYKRSNARLQPLEVIKSNAFNVKWKDLSRIMAYVVVVYSMCLFQSTDDILFACISFWSCAVVTMVGHGLGAPVTTPAPLDISQSGRQCSGPLSCWTYWS